MKSSNIELDKTKEFCLFSINIQRMTIKQWNDEITISIQADLTVLTVWCLPACLPAWCVRIQEFWTVCVKNRRKIDEKQYETQDVPYLCVYPSYKHIYVFWIWFRFNCDPLWRAEFLNDSQNNDQLLRFKRVLSLQLFLSALCVTFGNAGIPLWIISTELCLCVPEDEERLSYVSKVNMTSHQKKLHPFLLMLLMHLLLRDRFSLILFFRLSSFLSVDFQESYNN